MQDARSLLVHCPPSQDKLEDLSQATRSKRPAEPKWHGRGPRDWFPIENAELLFRRISQLLSRRKPGKQLLILMRHDFESHRIICFNVALRRRRTATGKRKVSSLPLYKMRQNVHFQLICYFSSFQSIRTPILIIFMLCIHSGYSGNSCHMQNS